jgi:hypothetical protein
MLVYILRELLPFFVRRQHIGKMSNLRKTDQAEADRSGGKSRQRPGNRGFI